MSAASIRVVVWNEFIHEGRRPEVAALYPEGIHAELARAISECAPAPVEVRTATLAENGDGLTPAELEECDVLVWWGHIAHARVSDELAEAVRAQVLRGMGLVALHASAGSKAFRLLMGTSCTLRWRHGDDRELVWCVAPAHPIADGVPAVMEIPEHEMYSEFFDIPAPDELVFVSNFSGGEVFRSGCCFRRGNGRIFFFSPGHETNPVYHQPEIRRTIANGVVWAHGSGPKLSRARASEESPQGWYAIVS